MKRLLIVDDDDDTCQLLTATFRNDCEIFQAADGINGLRMVLDHRPDLVILDGKMPRLDGLAVLGAIKSDAQLAHIQVVMLTGRGQFTDLERGLELGADAYFIKPVSPRILRDWVLKNLPPNDVTSPAPAASEP